MLASISTPSIAAGATYSVNRSVTIPSGTSTGTRYVWVILDVNSTANQSNENNDKANRSFSVTAPVVESDLIIQSFSVNPTSGLAGSSATVSFTIRNQGSGIANASTTNIRLSTSSSTVTSSDPLLATINTSSIAPGASNTVNQNVTIPNGTGAGTRYVWVILDVNSTANQSNENNDKANRSFTVTAPVLKSDLIIQSFSVNPTSGLAGSSVTVSLTIRNQGSGTANASTTNIRLGTSSGNVTTSDPLLALKQARLPLVGLAREF